MTVVNTGIYARRTGYPISDPPWSPSENVVDAIEKPIVEPVQPRFQHVRPPVSHDEYRPTTVNQTMR